MHCKEIILKQLEEAINILFYNTITRQIHLRLSFSRNSQKTKNQQAQTVLKVVCRLQQSAERSKSSVACEKQLLESLVDLTRMLLNLFQMAVEG